MTPTPSPRRGLLATSMLWSTAIVGIVASSVWTRPAAVVAIAALHGARTWIDRFGSGVRLAPGRRTALLLSLVHAAASVGIAHLAGWPAASLLYLVYQAVVIGAFAGSFAPISLALVVVAHLLVGAIDGVAPGQLVPACIVAVGVFSAARMRTAELELAWREARVRTAELERLKSILVEQEKLSSLGLLAAGIAHEINNPMAWVTSNVQLVQADLAGGPVSASTLAEWRDELLPEILDGVRRVNTIVADLRRFARREPEDSLASVEVAAEVERAMRLCERELPADVRVLLDLDREARVLGRADQVGQVIVNLLVNAGHAMAGREGDVRVGLRQAGREVVLTVSDQGCGMSPETRARLFEPFFTTKPPGQGVGLGLAVVHGIVASHGGSISVESAPGRGTTFLVRLPAELGPAPIVVPDEGLLRKLGRTFPPALRRRP